MTPTGSGPPRAVASTRSRLVAVAVAAGLVMALAGSCSGSDAGSSSTTTSIDPNDPGATSATAPPIRVFSDASQPIDVAVGEQFAIVLAAQPGTGKSWRAVSGPDLVVLVSIGTEFRDPGDAITGQTLPEDSMSQVLRYAARSLGTTQIALRYGLVNTAQADDPMLTFTVNVIDPNGPTTTS